MYIYIAHISHHTCVGGQHALPHGRAQHEQHARVQRRERRGAEPAGVRERRELLGRDVGAAQRGHGRGQRGPHHLFVGLLEQRERPLDLIVASAAACELVGNDHFSEVRSVICLCMFLYQFLYNGIMSIRVVLNFRATVK